MPLQYLDHVNLRTTRASAMKRFYCDALGLRPGPRPNFSFGGAWLYCGDRPVVHLVEVDSETPPSSELSLQHFAFTASGLSEFLAQLERHDVPKRLGALQDFRLCQVHVHDPDGNHVHVDFPLEEAEALGVV